MSTELESGAVALLDTIAGENAQKDTNVQDNDAVVMESGSGSTKDDPRFIHMPLTPELLAAARLKAGENVALGPWLQEYLAAQLGVTLPVKVDRRVRYTGPNAEELRKAAKVKAIEKAANLRKGLLMVHRARAAGDMVKLAEGEKLIADNS
jgi:hypothetical protein